LVVSDTRKTNHKAAEQRRRDGLKYFFDCLRAKLPNLSGDPKNHSKLFILEKCYLLIMRKY
jgi:hypothetical protein